jgi:hypothetical protein
MEADHIVKMLLIPNAKTFPYYSRFVRNSLRSSNYQLDIADEMFDTSYAIIAPNYQAVVWGT